MKTRPTIWIVCLALMSALLTPATFAGKGEYAGDFYVDVYNDLTKALNERCAIVGVSTNPLLSIDDTNPVTQVQLNTLRATIVTLFDHYVVPTNHFELSETQTSNAFPSISTVILTNSGEAGVFTKIPPDSTVNGTGAYSNSFDNGPVLWAHFQEINEAITTMVQVVKSDGVWTSTWYRSSPPSLSFDGWTSAVDYVETYWPIATNKNWGPCAYTWGAKDGMYYACADRVAGTYSVAGLSTQYSHAVHYYSYSSTNYYDWDLWIPPLPPYYWNDNGDAVAENSWSRWSSGASNFASSDTSGTLGDFAFPFPSWCNEPTSSEGSYLGYQVVNTLAIVDYSGLPNPDIHRPRSAESQQDAIVSTDCECVDCGPELELAWIITTDSQTKRTHTFGRSSGLTNGGLRVKAYVHGYNVGDAFQQMYSLDTRIIAHVTNTTEDGGWEFITVKRPSGAEVTFSLEGTSAGQPDNGKEYTAAKVGADIEIRFPGADCIVHRFGANGAIKQVTAKPYGTTAAAYGSPTHWHMMTTYTNDGGAILSNVCATIVAIPEYAGNTITNVFYQDADGNPMFSVLASNVSGGTAYILKDGNGNQADRKDIVDGSVIIRYYGTNGTVDREEIREEDWDSAASIRTITQTDVLNPGGSQTSNRSVTVVKVYPWGDEVIAVTNGALATDPKVDTYSYYEDEDDTNNYGSLELHTDNDGSWTHYQYDGQDRKTVVTTPFLSSDSSDPTDSALHRVTYYYYSGDGELTVKSFPTNDVAAGNDTRPRLIVKEVLGEEILRTYHCYYEASNVVKRSTVADANYTSNNNLVTVTHCPATGDFAGLPSKIEHADGTLTTYGYGANTANDRLTTTNETGAGTTTVTTGIRTITIADGQGRTLTRETQSIGATTITLSSTAYTRAPCGRVTGIRNLLNDTYTTNVYGLCDIKRIRDYEGIWTTNDYTELHQVASDTRLGVTTYYQHDVRGNVIETRRNAGGEDLISSSSYDQAGRLIATTNELGHGTAYAFSTNASGERVVTTTHPDNSTRIETSYLDGQLKSIAGTAVSPGFYLYGVTNNQLTTIEYSGTDASATEWVKTYTDMLGRTLKTECPDGYERVTQYNALGLPVAAGDGFTTNHTTYDDRARPYRTAIDMDFDGDIDLDETDRINETVQDWTTFDSEDVTRTISYIYPTISNGTPLEVSRALRRADGNGSWSIAFDRTNQVEITRDPDNAARTETATHPDGTQTISSYTNALVRTVTRKDSTGGTTSVSSFSYDSFNRLETLSETAASGDTRTTTYAYDEAGRQTNVTIAVGGLSQNTGTQFDSMGRPTKTIEPDGGEVDRIFNTRGELTQKSGARTYPVTLTYTDQGRQATLSTYRDGLGGDADTTTWQYDAQRGWMTNKVYADSSAVGYEYTANGALEKRTWARGETTEYSYDAAGSLAEVTWSDATNSYVRDRLGRPIEITDAIGTWTNAWLDDGQLDQVSLPQLAGGVLDMSHDSLGRLTNAAITIAGSPVHHTAYAFDNAGRLSAVSDGTDTAAYQFGPDGTTWTNLSFDTPMNTGRTFDGLNRLTAISSVPTNDSALSFAYSYNQANQRTTNTMADGSYHVYEYDSLGQLTSAKRYFSDGLPVYGEQWEYAFDQIGNRTSAENFRGASTKEQIYTANALNQYTSRTVPGEIFVTATASNDATVVVRNGTNNAVLANRHNDYAWQAIDVDNTAIYGTTNVQITAHIADGTNSSLVKTEIRTDLIPEAAETFTFDEDGNQTSSSLFTNRFNADNRLVQVESRAGVPDAFRVRVNYEFDHQGRITTRIVRDGYSGGDYATTNVTTYVWDAFNIIAEIHDTGVTNFFSYGPDMSGSLQGAGGVGGLLFVTLNSATNYAVAYNGNGDVMGLVNTDDGTVDGEYQYSPFGRTIKCLGQAAKDNPIRSSTQYTDPKTGQVRYPFRTYDPETGRWLSRDPIGHRGGLNLYGFCLNAPPNYVDDAGTAPISSIAPDPNDLAFAQPSDSTPGVSAKPAAEAELEKALLKLCPDKGAQIKWPRRSNKNLQCCRRPACEEQAKKFAAALGKLVAKAQASERGSWPTVVGGWRGNVRRRYGKGSLRNPQGKRWIDGLYCHEWTKEAWNSYRSTVIPYYKQKYKNGDGKGCFRFLEVYHAAFPLAEGGGGIAPKNRSHYWVGIFGPQKAVGLDQPAQADLFVDPWPNAGQTILAPHSVAPQQKGMYEFGF